MVLDYSVYGQLQPQNDPEVSNVLIVLGWNSL